MIEYQRINSFSSVMIAAALCGKCDGFNETLDNASFIL